MTSSDGRSANRQAKHNYARGAVKAHDTFTGEEFAPRAHNHYEPNDGKPAAPEIDLPRMSVRERVELLTRGGFNLYQAYNDPTAEADDDDNLDLVDDHDESPNGPMTREEIGYLAATGAKMRADEAAYEASQAALNPPTPENAPAGSSAPASPLPAAPEEPRPTPPPPAPGSIKS